MDCLDPKKLDTCEWGNGNLLDTAEQQHDSYKNKKTILLSEIISAVASANRSIVPLVD